MTNDLQDKTDTQILELIFDKMKAFFNKRHLDGKSLFRVLAKQTEKSDG